MPTIQISRTWTSSGSWPAPPNLAAPPRVQTWGEGGTGDSSTVSSHSGAGAGGGGFGGEPSLGGVIPGSTTLTITIGSGGTGTDTTVTGGSVTVTGRAGANGVNTTGGAGGPASGNTQAAKGGDGGNGLSGTLKGGGGGGSSAGPAPAAGNAGSAAAGSPGAAGGTAPTGGGNGGNGGNGSAGAAGSPGSAPGGGGGGGGQNGIHAGGTGAPGQAVITWLIYTPGPGYPVSQKRPARRVPPFMQWTAGSPPVGPPLPPPPPPSAPVRQQGPARKIPASMRGAPGVFTATIPGPPVPPPPKATGMVVQKRPGRRSPRMGGKPGVWTLQPASIVNQWAGTFAQPAAFQTTPPALQSVVVPLTPATSVGGGSGTSTAGNWLFCLVGWHQQSTASPVTVGDADDIHSYWRPGTVSAASGATRTSAWYTPNIARQVNDVYVAPNGSSAGMSVLVVEVSGLGPWDTVTGVYGNYAAAAASLNLALGVPSAQAFMIAAVTGDNSAASQAFAPPGWSVLQTVTAANGADHSCDAVLTSACTVTSSSVSVNATAVTVEDLSGVIIGVLRNAPSPIPAGQNPAWPYMILEAAFGAGFETPPDQMTWTSLNNWAVPNAPRRFWSWRDDSGVPYALGQLQSSTGAVQLDNADGALSPSNNASPYSPNVTTGTPIRIRCAIGAIGGTVVNRWYVIQRNGLAWPEKRNKILRNFTETTLTDIWSVAGGSCPAPYRGEILQESSLYAWYPMDDQALPGGVLPASLRNAAPGNANALNVIASPAGVTVGDAYTTTGIDTGSAAFAKPQFLPPGVAVYNVGQQQGWMPGDPSSSASSGATGNPVTASPGSAAWQQSGMQGAGGSNGWFLAVSDPAFPGLANGITVKGWFNAAFFGSAAGYFNTFTGQYYPVAGQPYSVITLATLSTGSAPVALLQLDLSGHLNLVTYNGSTPASHMIYSASDLRSSSWHSIDLQLTQTTWAVYVDGGLTASASGTVPAMTSAWTWLTLNGDYGAHGGLSPASIQRGGNVAYSHWKIFSSVLPPWRLLAHYCAAATAFGLLPAPQSPALSQVQNEFGTGYTPDGTMSSGNYGAAGANPFGFSAVVTAKIGSYTSGPSARVTSAGQLAVSGGQFWGAAVWLSWAGLAPQFTAWTSAAAGAEASAAVVNGSGDAFFSGYGAGAAGAGACQVSGGTGASPPAAPTPLGDTVAQRFERVLGYGLITAPNRAVDASASLLVQAARDTGGQAAGASLQNLVDSDNGLAGVDNNNTICYRSRPHLAADPVVWNIGMNVIAGMIPFGSDIAWSSDPQRIWDVIGVTPYSPDGASLATLTPANATAVNAAQKQFGPRPKAVTSYLQDAGRQQAQANWLFAQFGGLQRRAEVIAIDAASHPAAWPLVLGANCGDIAQIYDAPFGAPATTGTYRISQISRRISNGANGNPVEGKAVLVLDPVPGSYWS